MCPFGTGFGLGSFGLGSFGIGFATSRVALVGRRKALKSTIIEIIILLLVYRDPLGRIFDDFSFILVLLSLVFLKCPRSKKYRPFFDLQIFFAILRAFRPKFTKSPEKSGKSTFCDRITLE